MTVTVPNIDELLTTDTIDIKGIWVLFDRNDDFSPIEEVRNVEFNYIITDKYIHILLNYSYKEIMENTYISDKNNSCLLDRYRIPEQIHNYICEKNTTVPTIKDKIVHVFFHEEKLREQLSDEFIDNTIIQGYFENTIIKKTGKEYKIYIYHLYM